VSVAVEIVLGVAVLALLMFRQLQARPVRANAMRIMAVLGVIGVVETVEFLQKYHGSGTTYAALGGSLVLAAIFGVLRAGTTRLWLQEGQVWAKGNWLTAALWIVAVGAHLGYDAVVSHSHGDANVGNATIILYLAVSLGVQRVIVQQRANRLQPGGPVAPVNQYGQFS
jgi:hypothetical protein